MKHTILVSGSNGYVGSVLCSFLQATRYRVIGLDTGYYVGGALYHAKTDTPMTLNKDIRDITLNDLKNIDVVICLSDLTDSVSQNFEDAAASINYRGLIHFSSLSKAAGVRKFIYSSSASVYGYSKKICDESSKPNPLTPYAKYKLMVEKHLLSLSDENFNVVCLRNSTIYGLSPNIRFDLLVNNLCGSAIARKTIELKSDGNAWRPFVYIEDVCKVFIKFIEMPPEEFSNTTVNVGNGSMGNHRVIDIAQMIGSITGCKVILNKNNTDNRSYRVKSNKLNRFGLECDKSIKDGISDMLNFFEKIKLSVADLERPSFNRLDQISYLIKTKQLNNELSWTGI